MEVTALSPARNRKEEGDTAMTTETYMLLAGGFILGIALGCGFGLIQDTTFVLHKALRQLATLASNWTGIPGSSSRSIFLLVMLTLFQAAFTVLFGNNDIQWIVSAGVVLGYAWTLVLQFRQDRLYRS